MVVGEIWKPEPDTVGHVVPILWRQRDKDDCAQPLPHPCLSSLVFGPTPHMALLTLRVEWDFLCSISRIILIDIP